MLEVEAAVLQGGVTQEHWRKLKVRFDIEEGKIDVKLGGIKFLDDVKIEGIKIPKLLCIGVCAATSAGRSNHICVNALKLHGEADDHNEAIEHGLGGVPAGVLASGF